MTDLTPPSRVLDLGHGFFNLRGSFKIGGLIDVKTQASLVRKGDGRFVMIDACDRSPELDRWLDAITEGGALLDAFVHVHPFHTVYVEPMHQLYPDAKLYGTVRHHDQAPSLPWRDERSETAALHALFADDLRFTVPRGVELVPDDEKLHFASVLVVHPASRTMHVDDTLNYVRFPGWLRWLRRDHLSFHPTLAKVLERRPGAVADFREWCRELVALAEEVDHLCAAHVASMRGGQGPRLVRRIEAAIDAIQPTLERHRKRYG